MRLRFIGAAATTCALALSAPAFAHEGHGVVSSFEAGLAHPFGGLDHLAAMVAVGWAATLGPKLSLTRLLALPATFVAAMLTGALLGWAGHGLGLAEAGILASLVALGALLVFGARLSLPATLALVALAGLPHGIAHAAELPANGAAGLYMAGFALGTAALHALGVAAGAVIARGFGGLEPYARTAAAAGMAAIAMIGAVGIG